MIVNHGNSLIGFSSERLKSELEELGVFQLPALYRIRLKDQSFQIIYHCLLKKESDTEKVKQLLKHLLSN